MGQVFHDAATLQSSHDRQQTAAWQPRWEAEAAKTGSRTIWPESGPWYGNSFSARERKNIEKQFLPFVLVLAWDIQDSQTCHLSDLIVGRFVSTFPLTSTKTINLLRFPSYKLEPWTPAVRPPCSLLHEKGADNSISGGKKTFQWGRGENAVWGEDLGGRVQQVRMVTLLHDGVPLPGCHCCVPCWGAICRAPWLGEDHFSSGCLITTRMNYVQNTKIGLCNCWWLKSQTTTWDVNKRCKYWDTVSYLSLNGLAGFMNHQPQLRRWSRRSRQQTLWTTTRRRRLQPFRRWMPPISR